MRPNTSPVALRQARQHLLDSGQCPSGLVDERLARSWSRSLAAGLVPTGRPQAIDHPSSGTLRQVLASNPELLAHSRPVMEYLFEQVRHSQSVVVLADRRGMLMHTLGDPHFVDKAERVALTSGASWHEAHRGTNAIGTALAEACAVEVHGGEHFLERNSFLTCAASPILSATGELLGILDISGDYRNGHAHTLGLVSTAARMIENRLLAATCKRNIRVHLHSAPEGIGSVAEGIVAVSADGWIVGANRAALAQLGLHAGDVGATLLERVLNVRMDDLLSHHKRRPQQPQALRTLQGALLFAQVQMDSAWVTTPTRPAAVAAAVPQQDALAQLDTGDARWRAAADKARRVVGKPIAVLVQGESGVGKEVFARALHASGPRRDAPFVAINCAAIPEHLIESELFGHVAGAFTGARKEGHLGRLREAHGGTLFLDEIGDMPLALQTRLLRVLQERSVTPVGSSKAVPVDFALVCATHNQLLQAAEQGRFRQDLYYRINGLTVQLPALRERSDFVALLQRLLADLATEQGLGFDVWVAPDLLARLAAYPWPGNLRQLANVLRTASAMLAEGEDTLGWEHMPDDLVQALTAAPASPRGEAAAGTAAEGLPATLSLQQLSQAAIDQALQAARGNMSAAARQLGISRQTLYRQLADKKISLASL
ncbi:MAG: sigma-54-dependent Fis family transcriptional regulator [Gammaproteobacteria bacterium]|nr:sigma-54-dependent Fis family transcriptional regulator [Gammaproteobacteria bacterium]MBU1505961.1 sigma-54-dependent Fis family transcriptional regulator [Gammaproteobacteria bacterium]MBU2120405.1 sigma-54-dependent Fis family transcriptional regulator [Gammaproteobacteria bacterium]MBU2169733.1 sigma-54-dependent Fis family transcriptional regulator [Gammaproteobacteria bacterium]MBU2202130.1 sigma-54-dependent Fis family transcriptional regulator [Gammaproteobacteria bacterium]